MTHNSPQLNIGGDTSPPSPVVDARVWDCMNWRLKWAIFTVTRCRLYYSSRRLTFLQRCRMQTRS